MKHTFKSRLFAVLAISGAAVGWHSTSLAQEDFGIIRPAQTVPTQTPPVIKQELPPIRTAQAADVSPQRSAGLPPIVAKQASLPPITKRPQGNAPLAFAPSQVNLPRAAKEMADAALAKGADSSANLVTEDLPPITPPGVTPAVLQNELSESKQQVATAATDNGDSKTQLASGTSAPEVPVIKARKTLSHPPLAMQDGPPLQVPAAARGSLPQNVAVDPVVPPQSVPMVETPMPGELGSMVEGTIPTPSMGETYFGSNPVEAPVMAPPQAGCATCGSVNGGCPDCGVAGQVISSCQSCGAGGCYDAGAISSQFDSCGCMSYARRYVIAEALYYDRDDGFISNSNFGALNNFDWAPGWRVTIGRRSDSTRGREISYMGTLPMEQTREVFSGAGLIQSRFVPFDGFSAAQLTGFTDAVQQSQSKETFFHSVELNRVKWGWDVLKTYAGLRYFMIDDSYTMYSQSLGGDQGFYQQETINHLIGPHIGAELYYDVGYRWSLSLTSKAGVYANFNETDTVLDNNGVRFLNVEDQNGTIAGSYEFGLFGHYRLTRRARLKAGYNFLWLGEVASVSDNFNRIITPSTGANAGDSDDMFFHGASVGLEFYR